MDNFPCNGAARKSAERKGRGIAVPVKAAVPARDAINPDRLNVYSATFRVTTHRVMRPHHESKGGLFIFLGE